MLNVLNKITFQFNLEYKNRYHFLLQKQQLGPETDYKAPSNLWLHCTVSRWLTMTKKEENYH